MLGRARPWLPVAVASAIASSAMLLACAERDWHSPGPDTIGLFVFFSILCGAVGSLVRIALTHQVVPHEPIARASRFSITGIAFGTIATMTIAVVGSAVAARLLYSASPMVGSIVAAMWLGTIPWIQGFLQYALESSIAIGADAVTIGSRVIPLREVREVSLNRRTLILHLRSGSSVPIQMTARGVAQKVVGRIRAQLETATKTPAALARDGRSLLAWKRDLLSGGYREGEIAPDDAEHVLTSAAASPDERVGAALILVNAGRTDRVRVAATTCADARVRVALERTADNVLDEGTLETISRASVR